MARHSTREQIIEAGLRRLQKSGFNGCAVQDITRDAGVPKGSFYNHFNSKEALALLVLERFWLGGARRRAELLDSSVDPLERLRRHFKAHSKTVAEQEFQEGCLIGNFSAEMAQNDDFRARLNEMYDSWTHALEGCIKQACEAGKVKSLAPAEVVASFMISAWEGAVLRAKVKRNNDVLEQFELLVFSAFFD